MFEKVKKFVDDSFGKKSKHFERTVYWLQQIKPDADESMLIAAYAHDIHRAFYGEPEADFYKDKELNDKNYLIEHQEKGAEVVANFLRKNYYPEAEIKRVAEMVRLHEFGGTEEADVIKDADSVSYFEINALRHLEKFKLLGPDKIKRKFDFMYNRITSDRAKELARPFYEEAIKQIK